MKHRKFSTFLFSKLVVNIYLENFMKITLMYLQRFFLLAYLRLNLFCMGQEKIIFLVRCNKILILGGKGTSY